MTSLRRSKGAVLIVVLGVLSVLALLSVTFATIQQTERQVSRNYLDTVRARLLAQSGVQDAQARLKVYFPGRANDPGPKPWKYWSLDPTEMVEPGSAANPLVPLQKALNPSFAYEDEPIQNPIDPNVKPKRIMVDGQPRGFSGTMQTGTYGLFGDHYALKIRDLSGCIHVNDGIKGGSNGSVSQNLKRILNALGSVPTVKVPQLGDKILARRPPGGYRSAGDLQAAIGDAAAFERVREFLTLNAWVDRSVANPVPLSAATVDRYPIKYNRGTPPLYRFGKSKDARGNVLTNVLNTCPPAAPSDPSIRVYGLDTLNPQWIEMVSRAPVNVNAAPREVLVSLLTDLKGFFLTDRRRNNPVWSGGPYLAFSQQCLFSPAGDEGSEYGFLVETLPFVGPGSTVSSGISAFDVADEIIACRNRTTSKYCNYSIVPWGGPFTTWRQFNLFVDNLVTVGLLKDDRSIFLDYVENTTNPTGFGALVASPIQQRHASQALADLLKANFNPNLHLNELNPDENLYQIVDKTDLLVNSTEFTFLPSGYFEIESLGRVLRPKTDYTDCLLSPDNELAAQAKVTAIVKLYDMYRETSFKDFYGGTLPERKGAFDTSNNKSLEIGPEPDNGVFDASKPDNEWDGYLALPTVGGPYHGGGAHQKNTLQKTLDLPPVAQFNDAFHIHFGLDFDCHHHVLGPAARAEIASRNLPGETVKNWPDALPDGTDTPYSGPYAPPSGPGNVHRQARSFRLEKENPSDTDPAPSFKPSAPSDLRVDGGYSERGAAPAYFTSYEGAPIWDFDKEPAKGMVSYWFKPSFSPERTGKIRYLWDYSRYHDPCFQNCHVFPFALWFFPTQYNPAISEANTPIYGWGSESIGKFRPCSLVFGHCQWHGLPTWSWFGSVTDSLNHIGHPDEKIRPTIFRAHRWMQIAFQWHLYDPSETEGKSSHLYLNGSTKLVPFTWNTLRPSDPTGVGPYILKWNQHDGGDFNHMRLGGPSQIGAAPGTPYRGNYAADGTFDEYYVWKNDTDADPLTLWLRGRYYIPMNTTGGEALFTSQTLTFPAHAARSLAPPTAISTPGGSGPSSTVVTPGKAIRVLGMSWTWYGETTDPQTGHPVLYDYQNEGVPGNDLAPEISLGFIDGTVKYGPYVNDGYSPVAAPDGSTPLLQSPDQARYFVQFRIKNATLSSILLATPVLDDVTIYWDDNQSHLLSYLYDNRSF